MHLTRRELLAAAAGAVATGLHASPPDAANPS
jgi:hypothetical protein